MIGDKFYLIIASIPVATMLGMTGVVKVYYTLKDICRSSSRKRIDRIKEGFSYLVSELGLINSLGEYPKELSIEFIDGGYKLEFNIRTICDYAKVENKLDFIRILFGAYEVKSKNELDIITLNIYEEKLKEVVYDLVELNQYQLLLGYNHQGPLIADMKKGCHLLVSGLQGQGKTQQVKIMAKNLKNADIVYLNSFKNDFKGIIGLFINGQANILKYIKRLLENKERRCKPLYVVIDEMMTLDLRGISDNIKQLLSIGRHLNIFVIGIIQIATKENCKFKDLFTYRVSFKQIDRSSYDVCLGVSVPAKDLMQREFYFLGDDLYKGRTYKLVE